MREMLGTILSYIARSTYQDLVSPSLPVSLSSLADSWASISSFDPDALSSFNVSKYSSGKANLRVSTNITSVHLGLTPLVPDALASWSAPATLHVFFPAGSVNPGADAPAGGAQFYANPLGAALEQATNATLAYSVYFPADFEWAKGGKLPGLYGGHASCSGGDEALDCFSTRLMWREGGLGELYLYAAKDKQTDALCSLPPKTLCESSYGLSIARGSFTFQPGQWTQVRQTVALNTPGVQDGAFKLEVDGSVAIERDDVYYRGSVLEDEEYWDPSMDLDGSDGPMPLWITPDQSVVVEGLDTSVDAQRAKKKAETEGELVQFAGLFFSTFFGGQGSDWASPTDQYVQFKDFMITVNA